MEEKVLGFEEKLQLLLAEAKKKRIGLMAGDSLRRPVGERFPLEEQLLEYLLFLRQFRFWRLWFIPWGTATGQTTRFPI